MKKFDIIVLGGTSEVAKSLIPKLEIFAKLNKYSFAVAARNEVKFKELFPNNKTDFLRLDLDSTQSIQNVVDQAKLVLNLAGPFWKYGEEVVKICIAVKTHYIDISGEVFLLKT